MKEKKKEVTWTQKKNRNPKEKRNLNQAEEQKKEELWLQNREFSSSIF